jgi:hypothetical protein
MANKNDLFDFDETTASNNDNVQGANIAENCAPSGINNAIRGLASIVKRALGAQGSAIASAATTAIGAAGTALYATVTGTTAITSLGTVGAGTFRIVEFAGALTLTHNATSLKLPGAANITTAAGDIAFFISLGGGNWKCLHYSKADGSPVAGGFTGTLTSTDAAAGSGPTLELFRDSASPAAADEIGQVDFTGRSSTGVKRTYGFVDSIVDDPTNASEDAQLRLVTMVAGALQAALTAKAGVLIGNPTGGDKGAGSLNASGLYVAGHGTVAQRVEATSATYTSTTTAIPYDDTIPQNTEGAEVLTLAITPTNASSTLQIQIDLALGGSNPGVVNAALFVDSTASAIAARGKGVQNSTTMDSLRFSHSVSAGSTTARTYKVRIGPTSGVTTAYLNGDSGSRKLGGVAISRITVEEILPQ